ncbi:glycosyltransferase family 2 protein [Mucilaginibacter robiniae]|uniref:Glycosyltransferase family 2 protein n=1 Tax=Mucilaginibacter robiniae TaxID=2728022 RepID=A0A7L5E9L8_9SPHI|nr:glycosyltransferase family 2 protein [Mucilaginibacter robiniae]QJD97573.1 glycosyltransferase family 2 protein [Mucilaginibacter robiniae]
MPKPVALILLNWNTAAYTADCISSLQQYCNPELFDIIVADNGSTDNSLSVLQSQFPDLIFIDNQQNLGFAKGNNRALAYSLQHDYTYSLLLNTDTLVDEDIVYKLSKHLNQHPEVGAVQPAIYWMHEKSKIWNGKGRFNKILGLTISDTQKPQLTQADAYEIAEWVTGCCMLIRNEALNKSGLFAPAFFLYFEDVDLSFRLREAGYELHYLPSCKMYHEAGVSAKKGAPKKEGFLSPIIHYYISRNHIWILRRYGNPVFYLVYLLYNGSYYSALWVYFKLRSRNEKASSLIKGLKDGLFTPKALIWPKN